MSKYKVENITDFIENLDNSFENFKKSFKQKKQEMFSLLDNLFNNDFSKIHVFIKGTPENM